MSLARYLKPTFPREAELNCLQGARSLVGEMGLGLAEREQKGAGAVGQALYRSP